MTAPVLLGLTPDPVGPGVIAFVRLPGGADVSLFLDPEKPSYRIHPPSARSREADTLAGRLLERLLAEGRPPPAQSDVVISSVEGAAPMNLSLRLPSGRARLRIGPRGSGDHDLARWSATIPGEEGLSDVDRRRLWQAWLHLVAMLLREQSLQPTDARPAAGQVVGYLDLTGAREPQLPQVEDPGSTALLLHVSVPTACDLACRFCVDPPDEGADQAPETHSETLRRFLDARSQPLSAFARVEVVLAGHDCLNHPDLDAMLRTLDREPVAAVRLLTPGFRLAELAPTLAGHARLASVILTLLGPDAERHDAMTRTPGSFGALERGTLALDHVGIPWDLNTVLTRHNVTDLDGILAWAEARGRRVRIYVYNTEPFTPDEVVRDCAATGPALRAAFEAARPRVEAQVTGLQYALLCHLPPWARSMVTGHSKWFTDEPETAPNACSRCAVWQRPCPGPSRGLLAVLGEEGFEAIP